MTASPVELPLANELAAIIAITSTRDPRGCFRRRQRAKLRWTKGIWFDAPSRIALFGTDAFADKLTRTADAVSWGTTLLP